MREETALQISMKNGPRLENGGIQERNEEDNIWVWLTCGIHKVKDCKVNKGNDEGGLSKWKIENTI